jgi:hypothetical protein
MMLWVWSGLCFQTVIVHSDNNARNWLMVLLVASVKVLLYSQSIRVGLISNMPISSNVSCRYTFRSPPDNPTANHCSVRFRQRNSKDTVLIGFSIQDGDYFCNCWRRPCRLRPEASHEWESVMKPFAERLTKRNLVTLMLVLPLKKI